jgi:hypothetical protein
MVVWWVPVHSGPQTNRGFKARPLFSYYYIFEIEIFNRVPLHEEWR